jgi:hypothetical protein
LLNILDRDYSGLHRGDLALITSKMDGYVPRTADVIIIDEADHYDRLLKAHLGPDIVISDNCRPYYEETMRGNEMFIKMHKDMPQKEWDIRDLDLHPKGETPRGTTPGWIGGTKKTKQQRKVIKARRKQR